MKKRLMLSIGMTIVLAFSLCACVNTSITDNTVTENATTDNTVTENATTDNISLEETSSSSNSGQIIELSEVGKYSMKDYLLMECNYVGMESGGFKFKLITSGIGGTFQDVSTITIEVDLKQNIDGVMIDWHLLGDYDNVTMGKQDVGSGDAVFIDLDLPEDGVTETYFIVKGFTLHESVSLALDDAIYYVHLYQPIESGTFTYD